YQEVLDEAKIRALHDTAPVSEYGAPGTLPDVAKRAAPGAGKYTVSVWVSKAANAFAGPLLWDGSDTTWPDIEEEDGGQVHDQSADLVAIATKLRARGQLNTDGPPSSSLGALEHRLRPTLDDFDKNQTEVLPAGFKPRGMYFTQQHVVPSAPTLTVASKSLQP